MSQSKLSLIFYEYVLLTPKISLAKVLKTVEHLIDVVEITLGTSYKEGTIFSPMVV